MRVKTVSEWTNVLAAMTVAGRSCPRLFLSSGRDYLVYGLSWPSQSVSYGPTLLCQLLDDYGNLVSVPVSIFEITDNRIPSVWRAEVGNGSFNLWPEVFYREYFFDDLSDGVPNVVEAFRKARDIIEGEDSN